MRKVMFAVTALATFGAAAIIPAEADVPVHGIVINHPGCVGAFVNNGCIHGIILHCIQWKELNGKPPFVCVKWGRVPLQ
jgi:hypothetical protein